MLLVGLEGMSYEETAEILAISVGTWLRGSLHDALPVRRLRANKGGSASPPIVGWFKDATGSFSGGLYALALFVLFAAVAQPFACVRRLLRSRSNLLELPATDPVRSDELLLHLEIVLERPGRTRRCRRRRRSRAPRRARCQALRLDGRAAHPGRGGEDQVVNSGIYRKARPSLAAA